MYGGLTGQTTGNDIQTFLKRNSIDILTFPAQPCNRTGAMRTETCDAASVFKKEQLVAEYTHC